VYAGEEGGVAVADFGLARWRGTTSPWDGVFRGTLPYAAPEVARGEVFDARADRFALAASILHVCTGLPLHEASEPQAEGASVAAMLVVAGSSALTASHPWRALAPRLFPRELAATLLAHLAFDPGDRP
jgi:serine/threonine-protein kinase